MKASDPASNRPAESGKEATDACSGRGADRGPGPQGDRGDAEFAPPASTAIHWIHTTLGAVAVVPWNPKNQKKRDGLPPTWTATELGKRSAVERFFARVCRVFGLQRPPVCGWTAVVQRVALTSTPTLIVALAAHHHGRPDLLRSPKRVLAHLWEADMG